MDHNHVVTRFAPSPTGFMHIGGVRTALFAWLYARQHGGTFILRIEDTDKDREVPGSIEHIKESLQWLGLAWDFGPDAPSPEFGSCIQSERLESYERYARGLIDAGLAYPDPYTKEEVEAFREDVKAAERPFLFRDHRPETFGTWDKTVPLRFKVPQMKRYEWKDAVRGTLSAGEEMLDDFIIIKSDGYPTYNFAHIVDDIEMGVTHVMRGEEFISSVPKFLSLYEALNVPPPIFVTLPPIMGPDGKKKLSKRDGAKDLLEYRAQGYLPEALVNFLALIGWNPGTDDEVFTVPELIDQFSLARVQRSGAAFNEQKLDWLNREHLKRLDEPQKAEYVLNAVPGSYSQAGFDTTIKKLTPTILERIHNGAEIKEAFEAGEYDWAFSPLEYETSLLKWKKDDSVNDALPRLKKAQELLREADFGSPEGIKEALWPYSEEAGKGEVLWPLRVALTGRERSPDPFTCAYVLGREEALDRITKACDKIEA